jgi:hypothetical protein
MKQQTKPARQSMTRPASGKALARAVLTEIGKVLTGAVLTEVKGGVAYDMATSPGAPRVPADTTWG